MKKREYVPPRAEVLMLAPCEELAVWEWGFGSKWTGQQYFQSTDTLASGIAMGGKFSDSIDMTGEGFVIKNGS